MSYGSVDSSCSPSTTSREEWMVVGYLCIDEAGAKALAPVRASARMSGVDLTILTFAVVVVVIVCIPTIFLIGL